VKHYRFQNPVLFREALTHKSFGQPHNERLEFLGDSLLNCTIAILLHRQFPSINEGDLSRIRASLVCQETLAELALQLGIDHALRLGSGEAKSGGATKPSILADALEAYFAAVYLDSSFDNLLQVIQILFASWLETIDPDKPEKDAKTRLQEWLQAKRLAIPTYETVNVSGKEHAQEFTVRCFIADLPLETLGSGTSKRRAEQLAAQAALEQLTEHAN